MYCVARQRTGPVILGRETGKLVAVGAETARQNSNYPLGARQEDSPGRQSQCGQVGGFSLSDQEIRRSVNYPGTTVEVRGADGNAMRSPIPRESTG